VDELRQKMKLPECLKSKKGATKELNAWLACRRWRRLFSHRNYIEWLRYCRGKSSGVVVDIKKLLKF